MDVRMPNVLAYIIIFIYSLALLYITIFCLMQFQLLWYYLRKKSPLPITGSPVGTTDTEVPFVTVQLPVFNEVYVVERLIDAVAALDYPHDKLEIQVLDDSTDDTSLLVARKVEQYAMQGVLIVHLQRVSRVGYKAGALKYGLEMAKGDLIAIFDADFVPRPDFLRQTVPYFSDPKVGVVQTHWEHINQAFSILTQLQALQLNVHFTVEQGGRQAAGLMLQFNGTAGVWRRQAIIDAGGWQADTLTEDLDLSYRAQLRGWKVRYLEDVGAPAELPVEMPGLKSQQFRWMKGGAETARKILPRLWRAPIGLQKKLHGTLHLLSSAIFVFVFVVGVVSVPVLFAFESLQLDQDLFSIFLIGLLSIAVVYFVGNVPGRHSHVRRNWAGALRFLLLFPAFLALSMGLSLHNTVAVLQGYLGRESAFVRTPKFNIRTAHDSFRKRLYRGQKLSWITIGEGLLALYFFTAVVVGLQQGYTAFIFFHALLMAGYGAICYYSIRHLAMKP